MESQVNTARLRWDVQNRSTTERYEKHFEERSRIPATLFENRPKIWLEVGAGSGWFFTEMARLHPDTFLLAIERCRMRGKRLERKTRRSGLPNLAGYRGNAIPALIHAVPSESVERLYILYPCPWLKTAQRKNRWYLHPVMPHFLRILKPGGLIVWASDQTFYIDEARYVSETFYPLETLVHGPVAPNPHNGLEHFPGGRTKFERTFLEAGHPCFELISRKSAVTKS